MEGSEGKKIKDQQWNGLHKGSERYKACIETSTYVVSHKRSGYARLARMYEYYVYSVQRG